MTGTFNTRDSSTWSDRDWDAAYGFGAVEYRPIDVRWDDDVAEAVAA